MWVRNLTCPLLHLDRTPKPPSCRVSRRGSEQPRRLLPSLPVPTVGLKPSTGLLHFPSYTAFSNPQSLLRSTKKYLMYPICALRKLPLGWGFLCLQHLRVASQGDQVSSVDLTLRQWGLLCSYHTELPSPSGTPTYGPLFTNVPVPKQLYHSMVFSLFLIFSSFHWVNCQWMEPPHCLFFWCHFLSIKMFLWNRENGRWGERELSLIISP